MCTREIPHSSRRVRTRPVEGVLRRLFLPSSTYSRRLCATRGRPPFVVGRLGRNDNNNTQQLDRRLSRPAATTETKTTKMSRMWMSPPLSSTTTQQQQHSITPAFSSKASRN